MYNGTIDIIVKNICIERNDGCYFLGRYFIAKNDNVYIIKDSFDDFKLLASGDVKSGEDFLSLLEKSIIKAKKWN